MSQRTSEMATILSDRSGSVLAAIVEKGEQFAGDVGKATEQAIKAIEDRGFAFTRNMMDNSAELSRMINTAGETAANMVTRTVNDLHETAAKAIEKSKDTATSTVTQMMETHNMLRTDTTALFERLREANLMLQEVLSGAHENMGALENTLMLRVSEFVSAMNEVTSTTGETTSRVEANVTNFRDVTARVVTDLGQLANQFDSHGRALASAVELVDRSNQRTENTVNERRVTLDSLVSTLDIRTEDLDQRLKRFSGLLDESLEAASARARDVARVVAEASAEGSRALNEQYERVRGDTQSMFQDANERFGEVLVGMKQMANEMQRELESTRSELRRGIFDLPQETAESAAHMRRVIVDQIEALAELNRIVARHGRNLDAVEPMRRARGARRSRRSSAAARGGPRPIAAQLCARRHAARRETPAARARRQAAAARLAHRSAQPRLARRGRAAARADARTAPPPPPRRTDDRTPRHSIESLDSLSVDIARMIDHDAAADLWDRYKRGERNVFTRRLYTLQGQKAFDEIRAQVPRRPRVQADGRPLYRRVRAPARRSLARRPRPGGGAHLSDLGNRQGLHHAGARGRALRLNGP